MKLNFFYKLRAILIMLLMVITHAFYATSGSDLGTNFQDRPLIEVLDELSETYQVFFTYNDELLNNVNVEFTLKKNEKLETAVNRLLAPVGFKYEQVKKKFFVIYKETQSNKNTIRKLKRKINQINKLENKGKFELRRINKDPQAQIGTILETISKLPQDISITGTVTDENGEPMIGVTILVKGTSAGTTSDLDGKFELDAPEDATTLVFSYVGYTPQEIEIAGRTIINVTMTPSLADLSEVVVVGYGTQKKINLTGSVASIGDEELTKRPVSNPANLLQGKVAGVEISQAFAKPGDERNSILIRGAGTFSGTGNSPLILINGVAGDMTNLNPDDIESISVLKDAASSAIYGARAANGVILVTTKQGQNQRASINYHYNLQAHQATRLPELLYNSADYMELWNEARERAGRTPHFTQATIDAFRNNPNDPNYPNFDWIDHSFRTGIAHNHHLNVNGGNDNTNYNLSLGYYDQDGITSLYEFQKYNALFSINSHVTDWLKLGGEIQFVRKDITRSAWDNDVDYQILAIYGAGPNYTPTKVLPDGSVGYIARYSSSISEWTVRNPDAQDASGSRVENNYNILPQVSADVQLIKGLTWRNKLAFQLINNFLKAHERPVDNYYFEDNSYAHNNATWRLGVTDRNQQSTLTTYFSTLNYDTNLGDVHAINILAGYNQESFLTRSLSGFRRNFTIPDIKELNGGSPEGQRASGSASEWAIRSYFGRLAYSFDHKYLLEVNARYDGTSRISPDNRWGFFPSVSGAWRISEEDFADIGWLDNLKLRASWGRLGNQNVGTYPYQPVLSFGSYPFGGTTSIAALQTRLVDENLKWETTTMTDFGFDLSINRGLLDVTFDWYHKVTTDILYGAPIPSLAGLSPPTVNFGEMANKGIEVVLGHRKQIRDFGYYVSLNFARNRNEVLKLNLGDEPQIGGTRITQVGLPWNSHYLIEWTGIFQNEEEIAAAPTHPHPPKPGDLKFKDQNGDGVINGDDRILIDGAHPDFTYGGSVNLNWKNFSLSAFFQGISGRKQYNGILSWGQGAFMQGSPPPVDLVNNRWTPDNPTNKYPAIFQNGYGPVTGTNSTYWLFDASYFRLKNLLIEYRIPTNLVENIGIRDLRVYASGDNLLTITNYPGSDPEQFDNQWFTSYPQVRIFTLGARIKL